VNKKYENPEKSRKIQVLQKSVG